MVAQFAVIGWALVLAALYRTWRNDWFGAVAIGIGVASHWLLDWITHRRDMPLYPYGPQHGLGLWNSIAGTLIVELAIFFVGVGLYARATRARDRWGRWDFCAYVALLLVLFIGDRFSALPAARAVARAGLAVKFRSRVTQS